MIAFYKDPIVPDQDKENSGNLLFGIQNAQTYRPLFGYFAGNNSAIVSFFAVKVDLKRNERSRTALEKGIIIIDSTNNIYKIDTSKTYVTSLDQCIYRFEVQNDSELYKSEYFLVQEDSLFITADTTIITADNDEIYVNDTNITI